MSTLKRAILLAKQGHIDKAVALLHELTEANPTDLLAWLTLAEYSPDPAEAAAAAYHVLDLRPTHRQAKRILQDLGQVPYPHRVVVVGGKTKRIPDVFDTDEGFWVGGVVVILALLFVVMLAMIVIGVATGL